MSGFVFAMGPCICCGEVFRFNPHSVPSTSEITGQREPVCRTCMTIANAKRKAMGLEPHPILPDAYEPLPENEF